LTTGPEQPARPLDSERLLASARERGVDVASIVLSAVALFVLDGRLGLAPRRAFLFALVALVLAIVETIRRRRDPTEVWSVIALSLALVAIVASGLVVLAVHGCKSCP
jgi:hypothetical protein